MTAAVEEFQTVRPRLLGLAYRLLGEASEAEDVVQDAYLRLAAADLSLIESLPAWLAKVVTNLCLNRLTSARARRETYVGPWLPEPVLTSGSKTNTGGVLGPLETVEQRDTVSYALLTLMERLTPAERAVFVLREAFEYSHREIADILEVSQENSRQLHSRARQRLGNPEPRFEPDRVQWRALVDRFLGATRSGDVAALTELLTAEVSSTVDGGGKVGTARRTVVGRERVARYLIGAFSRPMPAVEARFAEVNGGPAVLAIVYGVLMGILFYEVVDGRVAALRICANPEKLAFAARQLSHPGALPGS